MVSGIGKAMHCGGNLGMNKRRAKRTVRACELRGEHLQAIEGIQIAEKLSCQALVSDNRLRNARAVRVLCETCPGATARALQIDRGDLAVGRGWTGRVKFHDRTHAAAAKRCFRLPSPVLTNVETMVRTALSGLLLARNSTRHSATEPLPFCLTSITPA